MGYLSVLTSIETTLIIEMVLDLLIGHISMLVSGLYVTASYYRYNVVSEAVVDPLPKFLSLTLS